MAQEANSSDPGSIPSRDTSYDVPESSCLLSGPGLKLDSRYTCSREWFGGSNGMPSAGEEDSVTGTLKNVKSSVAWSGGVVLRWSSGYGTKRLIPETRVRSPFATHLLPSLNLPVSYLAPDFNWIPVTETMSLCVRVLDRA